MRSECPLQPWSFPQGAEPAFAGAPFTAASPAAVEGGRLVTATETFALEPSLSATLLAATAGVTVGACDAQDRLYRLHCAAPNLWSFEPVIAGQRRTLALLRAQVLFALGTAIVHELQNPLNAAYLRSELLRGVLQRADDAAQRDARLRQLDGLRDRLNHLAALQASLAQRWLGEEPADALSLDAFLDDMAAPLRSYCARRGISLQFAGAAEYVEPLLPGQLPALRAAICTVLLMQAADASEPQVGDAREIVVSFRAADLRGQLELPLPRTPGPVGAPLGWSVAQVLDALGFSLAGCGIHMHCAETVVLDLGRHR